MNTITGEEINRLRKHLGLTQPQLAEVLGTSPGSITRWESYKESEVNVDRRHRRFLFLLQRLYTANGSKLSYVVQTNLAVHGGLRALYEVLRLHYSEEVIP